MSIEITVPIQLVQPLNIAQPTGAYISADGRVRHGKAPEGCPPCTATERLKVVLPEFMVEQDEDAEYVVRELNLAVLPGNNLRGRLRRAASKIIFNALLKKDPNNRIILDAFHVVTTGAVSGQPSGVAPTVSEMRAARDSLAIGLFGGSPMMIPGTLMVETAFPITEKTIALNLVKKDFAKLVTQEKNLTSPKINNRWDDVVEHRDFETCTAIIKDFNEAYAEWMEFIAKNGDKDAKNKAIRSFTFVEVVNPGTIFQLSYRITTEAPHQVGLLMQSICDFLNNGIMGGMSRKGFGKFHAMDEYSLARQDYSPDAYNWIVRDPASHKCMPNTEIPVVAEYMAALDQKLSELEVADVEVYAQNGRKLTVTEVADVKGKGKKAKSSKAKK